MDLGVPRPRVWTDRGWAMLARLVTADPAWTLPAAHPELFGLGSRGVALATYLLERGSLPPAPRPEGAGSVAWLDIEGRTLKVRFGPVAAVAELVGTFPDDPTTWHQLTLLPRTVGQVEVARIGDELELWVSLRFRRSNRSDLLADLTDEAARVRSGLTADGGGDGAGYAAMLSRFVRAGLAVPQLPTTLRASLREIDDWHWSTRGESPKDRLADYLMDTIGAMEGAVEDHATVSHGGHGINSYALTWRMAVGPLAFVVQDAWGGAYGDAADNGALAELFARVAGLVRSATARMNSVSAPAGPWVRPVAMSWSPMRGIRRCAVWDPRVGHRLPLDLSSGDAWEQVAWWVDHCSVPEVTPEQALRLSRRKRTGSAGGAE